MSYYRDRSRSVIQEAYNEAVRMDLLGKAMTDFIAAAYPFDMSDRVAAAAWARELSLLLRPKRRARDQGRDLFGGGD